MGKKKQKTTRENTNQKMMTNKMIQMKNQVTKNNKKGERIVYLFSFFIAIQQ